MKNRQAEPFALVGVRIGGADAPQLQEVMKKEGITLRSFVDLGNAGAGPIATSWNLSATPTFYVIDHTGLIRHKWSGPPGEQVMDAALDTLIQAAEADGADSLK